MSKSLRATLVAVLYLTLASTSFSYLLEIPENNTHSESSYLTVTELELFRHSLGHIKDEQCRRDLNATLWGLLNNQQWAVALYDASVRNPVGIESSIHYQLGHYDQCLQQRIERNFTNEMEMETVQAQYCLVDVTLRGANSDDKHSQNEAVITHWGECLPAVCNTDDIATFLRYTMQRNITVREEMCQLSRQQPRTTTGMIIFACVILFFLILSVFGTGYDLSRRILQTKDEKESQDSKLKRMLALTLLSFSVLENAKKLFQSNKSHQDLSAINGIKAIAMFFILCGHAVILLYGIPLYNMDFLKESSKKPYFGYISNSLVFVDTFLLISSYLFVRLVIIELEKHRGRLNPIFLYVTRYLRLTPSYLMVICFYMTWLPHIGSGPLWPHRIERERENCQSSWWLNLLYVNNYFNTDQLCMFQSWYLAVDTQLFFVAPLITMFIYKSRKHGVRLLTGLVCVTSIVPFFVTYFEDLPPTFLVHAKEAEHITNSDYYKNTYVKTHMRAASYFIGLLAGYLGHLMATKSIKLHRNWVRLLWIISVILGMSALFSIYTFYASPYGAFKSAMYAALHKLAWNLANAWWILAVTTDNGGWLQRFLSNHFFVPLSRLSYCAYLVNGLVLLTHTSMVRSPSFLNFFEADDHMFAYTLDTYMIAFVICLLFESPIRGLERMIRLSFAPSTRREKPYSNGNKDTTTTPAQTPI